VLDVADLEMNVLEFRQRAFQFDRLAEIGGTSYAVFTRTETETESKFRPKLVHLRLAVPHAWVVLDPTSDLLVLSKDGASIPVRLTEPVVEVAAEPAEFGEQGIAFRRVRHGDSTQVYAPAEVAAALFTPEGLAALGLT